MAVLTHTPGSAPDLIQAGKWEVQVQTGGTSTSPVYSFIYGLTDFSPKPDIGTEDATDIYDDGWKREVGVSGAYNIDVTGNVRGTLDDGTGEFVQDPGQAALIAAAEDFGNTVKLRWWRRDGIDLAYQADVISKVTMDGGKPGSLQKFSGQILVQGKPQSIAKPGTTSTVAVGAASAGTFTLVYKGKTTAAIAYNANATAVRDALAALDDGYVAADWTVTGASPTWTVTAPSGVITAGTATGLTGGTFAVS